MSHDSVKERPFLFVLSGPSGVGKDTVLRAVEREGRSYYHVVTITTREQRDSEREGIDYQFVTEYEFAQMRERDELIESALVYGNWYGVPKIQIDRAFDDGKDVLVKVDIQGAITIKELYPDAVLIFLEPPSFEELKKRLVERKTESDADLELRLKEARKEMSKRSMFDYFVVNRTGKMREVVAEIIGIIDREKFEVGPGDQSNEI